MYIYAPVYAILGGAMIGIALVLVFWFTGRIAGISGLIGRVLSRNEDEKIWRLFFLAGMVLSGFIYHALNPDKYSGIPILPTAVLITGGFLVGFGTRMGNGCTSGHGIFGIARLSKRSIIATLVFMSSAIATVYLNNHVLGTVL